MSLTPSTMLPLGTIAPDFSLLDTASSKTASLQQLKSDVGTVIMFICNHCPFVKHLQAELVTFAKSYQDKGLQFIAINSNDVENYPDDSPERMQQVVQEFNYPFPYLFDETQDIAHAYQAACTPDFYLFDGDLACVYRGQFDSSRPGNNTAITGEDLAKAIDCILAGKPIDENQRPSVGCNIKWKG